MLNIVFKKPCYTCEFSNIEIDNLGRSILYCYNTPQCKIKGEFERKTDVKEKLGHEYAKD